MARCAGVGLSEVARKIEKITLTVVEAQAFSGLGRNTLLSLIQSGEVQARRIGARRWLVVRDSLEAWLRGGA